MKLHTLKRALSKSNRITQLLNESGVTRFEKFQQMLLTIELPVHKHLFLSFFAFDGLRLSKKTFWQLNAAFGLAFISLYIFNQNAPHYYVYHLQILINNLSEKIGFNSTVEGITLLLILASVLLFLWLRYGNLGQKLKFNLFTIYALLATNVSILSYLSYNKISWSLNIYEQLSAFGLGGLLNVISKTCIALAATSFTGTLIWHYLIQPNPKLNSLSVTLLQPKPPIKDQTQSRLLKIVIFGLKN